MSLVSDRATREVITSLTLLVFGARSLFATRFRTCRSFGKDSYRDGVIGKNNAPHVLLRHHLQYFIIVLEADADVS
jgi:hypothetical protein